MYRLKQECAMEGTETVGGSQQMNAPIFGSETMIVV